MVFLPVGAGFAAFRALKSQQRPGGAARTASSGSFPQRCAASQECGHLALSSIAATAATLPPGRCVLQVTQRHYYFPSPAAQLAEQPAVQFSPTLGQLAGHLAAVGGDELGDLFEALSLSLRLLFFSQ